MIICGVDPGFAIVGFGVLRYEGNKFTTIEFGCLRTEAGTPLSARLLSIHDGLYDIVSRRRPDAFAVETLFFNTNQKTAIAAAHGRGAALLAAARFGTPVFEYAPPQVKMAVTGYGRADKTQVQRMVKTILGLEETPKPDDVADALAVAICHAHSAKMLSF